MANGGLPAVIGGPQLTPPRISLLSAADIVPTGDDERWYAGFEYRPDGCGEGNIFPICPEPDPISSAAPVKEICRGTDVVSFAPYVIYGSDTCSTWGHEVQDYVGRARRRLRASESFWLEHILWGGPAFTLAYPTIAALNNPIIANPASTVVTPVGGLDPVRALAAIDDALGDCQRGNRSMIHMRPGLLTRLATNGSVRREGNVWLTAMDNIVVPGRGYEGTGPTGQVVAATEWMYATSMVQVRRGPEVVLPSEDDDWMKEAVRRSTNDVEVIVERVAHAAFDPQCCLLAAEVIR